MSSIAVQFLLERMMDMNPAVLIQTAAGGPGVPKEMAEAAQLAIQRRNLLPSDSEVLKVIDHIAMSYLGASLTPSMQQQYLSQYNGYIKQGITPDQAFDRIANEFEAATNNQDISFYESRTGLKLSSGSSSGNSNVDPELLPYVQKAAGTSGGNNMLIYGGIALVGLYLLFGNKGKGLSGTPKKTKSRKPAKKAKSKGKGMPAPKSKKSGRVQVIDL